MGLHAGSGSEYINPRRPGCSNKLDVEEFIKSRPPHCNDNAHVESKNGTVVRHNLGRPHIPRRHAARVNGFKRDVLSSFPQPAPPPPSRSWATPDDQALSLRQRGRVAQSLDDARAAPQAGRVLRRTRRPRPLSLSDLDDHRQQGTGAT